ncbi:hypothetical protein HK104_004088 [Borealophlyctis nickersoniae]|nr:hypothetical protein HK104_004088 [Borealophlyctis nickersoniae]
MELMFVQIEGQLEKSWEYNYHKHPAAIRNAEETYECCGLRNVTDRAYPKGALNACIINPDFMYTRSCLPILEDEFQSRQFMLGVGGLVLALVQGATLVPTWYLVQHLDEHTGNAGERARLLAR